MVACPKCGMENPEDMQFCWNCGSKLEASAEPAQTGDGGAHPMVCPKCGKTPEEGADFCWNCGFKVLGASPDSREPTIGSSGLQKPPEPQSDKTPGLEKTVHKSDRPTRADPRTSAWSGKTKFIVIGAVALVLIVAAFLLLSPAEYRVQVDVVGDGAVTGTGVYKEGSEITLTAIDSGEAEFYKWSDGKTARTRTFTVSEDVHLTAYFDYFYDVKVTQTYSDAGKVTGGGHYRDGTSVTLTATQEYGYKFTGWVMNGSSVSTDRTYTFFATEDCNITASYAKETFTISISKNYQGGNTSGSGRYDYKNTATLTTSLKSGYNFDGWYIDGTCKSTSTAYNLEVTKNQTVQARYSIIHDASFYSTTSYPKVGSQVDFAVKYSVEISSYTWTFTDVYNGGTPEGSWTESLSSFSFKLNEPTYVEITRTVNYTDGTTYSYTTRVTVDSTETRTLSWKYQASEWYSFITDFLAINNKSAQIDVDIPFKKYAEYRNSTVVSRHLSNDVYSYVTVNDPIMQTLIVTLSEKTSGMSDLERANCVLKLVQSIEYKYDDDTRGQSDWFKYPIETLWDMNGDCEDHAILYATLMEGLGYDTVLFYVYCYDSNGTLTAAHLATGLDVSGGSGKSLTYNGTEYYYCEATAIVGESWINQASVGYVPSGYVVKRIYHDRDSVSV